MSKLPVIFYPTKLKPASIKFGQHGKPSMEEVTIQLKNFTENKYFWITSTILQITINRIRGLNLGITSLWTTRMRNIRQFT